jgi:hypothetical protein
VRVSHAHELRGFKQADHDHDGDSGSSEDRRHSAKKPDTEVRDGRNKGQRADSGCTRVAGAISGCDMRSRRVSPLRQAASSLFLSVVEWCGA